LLVTVGNIKMCGICPKDKSRLTNLTKT